MQQYPSTYSICSCPNAGLTTPISPRPKPSASTSSSREEDIRRSAPILRCPDGRIHTIRSLHRTVTRKTTHRKGVTVLEQPETLRQRHARNLIPIIGKAPPINRGASADGFARCPLSILWRLIGGGQGISLARLEQGHQQRQPAGRPGVKRKPTFLEKMAGILQNLPQHVSMWGRRDIVIVDCATLSPQVGMKL